MHPFWDKRFIAAQLDDKFQEASRLLQPSFCLNPPSKNLYAFFCHKSLKNKTSEIPLGSNRCEGTSEDYSILTGCNVLKTALLIKGEIDVQTDFTIRS